MTLRPAVLPRRRRTGETIIEAALFGAASIGVVTTLGIVAVLLVEAAGFFSQVPVTDFLFGTVWSATIEPVRFGVLPLVAGTFLVATIALLIAVPLGLLAAIYLAEYASLRVRNLVKPVLETIAGIPTIVLGFFAIGFVTPNLLRPILGDSIGTFSALAGGIVVGILIAPLVASLSEDALRAVPRSLREGAYALGATRWEVVRSVALPAAISGVMASVILAASRAIGETMAVVLAVGTNPQLTLDPRESIQTMTAFIVQISLGDTPQGSIQFLALFAVALVLFLLTFGLNLVSNRIVERIRERYA